MNTTNFKIEPCILVRDRITVDRGVSYIRRDLSATPGDDGSEDATWFTDRHYKNKEETKQANNTYMKARNRIRQVCLSTDIGFICPLSRKEELAAAIQESKEIADDFNRTAKVCRVNHIVVCTMIEPENKDAEQLINETVHSIGQSIKAAVANLDFKTARGAVKQLTQTISIVGDVDSKVRLEDYQKSINTVCDDIKEFLKEYGKDVDRAMHPEKINMFREQAEWDF